MKIHKCFIALFTILLVYAIYLPITTSFDFSISLFVFTLCGGYYLITSKKVKNQKYINLYAFFIFVLFFPILYSTDINQGLLYLIKNLFSLLMICIGVKFAKSKNVDKTLKIIILVSVPLMIVNILFALNNDAEFNFLESILAKYFVSPTSLASWRTNNITDINKGGTIFPNTNNASVFFSILLAVITCTYISTKKKKYIVIGFLSVGAILATGCRTGILVLIVDMYIILFVVNKKITNRIMYGVVALVTIIAILQFTNMSFLNNSISRFTIMTLRNDPRIILWEFALKRLNLLGYGYGGWENLVRALPSYYVNFPPHNHLLVLAFIGGIIPAIIYIFFWGSMIIKSYKRYKTDRNCFALLLLMTCITIVIHGLFDNYFLTQTNILQITFFIVGLCTSKITKTIS